MKNLLYFICIFCLGTSCRSQEPFKVGTTSINGKKFIVGKYTSQLGGGITVHSERKSGLERYPWPKSNAIPVLKTEIHFDTAQVKKIIFEVIKRHRKVKARGNGQSWLDFKNQAKGNMWLDFTFTQKGDIDEIGYTMKEELGLDINDIAKIDKFLKAKIKATFSGKNYLDFEFISFNNFILRF